MLPAGLDVPIQLDRSEKYARCYQIMESENPALLTDWTKNWNDLIDFEIIPVQSSAEFWANLPKK